MNDDDIFASLEEDISIGTRLCGLEKIYIYFDVKEIWRDLLFQEVLLRAMQNYSLCLLHYS